MGILNYTTTVSAEKSYSQIQTQLVRVKAQKITSEYDEDGNLKLISFSIKKEEEYLTFNLPANVEGVYKAMCRGRGSKTDFKKLKARSVNVAWRILKDWIEAQVAIIEAGLAKTEEVFIPYWVIGESETLFHFLERQRFSLALKAPKDK